MPQDVMEVQYAVLNGRWDLLPGIVSQRLRREVVSELGGGDEPGAVRLDEVLAREFRWDGLRKVWVRNGASP